MIALESVSKRYGARTVLHDLSFTVERGEIVGFLGPNGAGKTTTLRLISGYTTATTGRVRVAGHDMASEQVAAARHIGYLPERPPLYDNLDVAAYLGFVAKAKGLSRAARGAEIERVVRSCRLEEVFRREIFKLSKGFRQRVGLAQALLGDADVLLLDEPTIGLDPGQIHETREAIRAAGAGRAVLLSTHILAEVTPLCARVAILHHGRLLAIDTPEGLERAVQHSAAVVLEASAEVAALRDTLLGVDGVTAVECTGEGRVHARCLVDARDGVESAIARRVAARFDLHRLERQRPTLENVFLHYVGGAADEEIHP
jgi:ABC-2 type transport system ATP-binding protein